MSEYLGQIPYLGTNHLSFMRGWKDVFGPGFFSSSATVFLFTFYEGIYPGLAIFFFFFFQAKEGPEFFYFKKISLIPTPLPTPSPLKSNGFTWPNVRHFFQGRQVL